MEAVSGRGRQIFVIPWKFFEISSRRRFLFDSEGFQGEGHGGGLQDPLEDSKRQFARGLLRGVPDFGIAGSVEKSCPVHVRGEKA